MSQLWIALVAALGAGGGILLGYVATARQAREQWDRETAFQQLERQRAEEHFWDQERVAVWFQVLDLAAEFRNAAIEVKGSVGADDQYDAATWATFVEKRDAMALTTVEISLIARTPAAHRDVLLFGKFAQLVEDMLVKRRYQPAAADDVARLLGEQHRHDPVDWERALRLLDEARNQLVQTAAAELRSGSGAADG